MAHIIWSYEGDTSPPNWSRLHANFCTCSGSSQSPIDISNPVETKEIPPLKFDYVVDNELDIENSGRTILVYYSSGSKIIFKEKEFRLVQFHFHVAAEHTLDGHRPVMEMHLVHTAQDGQISVVALLFEVGKTNQVLNQFWDHLPTKEEHSYSRKVPFKLSELIPDNLSYHHYEGSLTTPPCSEQVNWIVLKQKAEISEKQLNHIANIMCKNNYRPVQELNGRKIWSVDV